ncbi:MAG: hypothetical protein HYZ44_13535 [Bacteroidetes bacterium]|nr:hypothetical protein [Bacteroidota bacterium]
MGVLLIILTLLAMRIVIFAIKKRIQNRIAIGLPITLSYADHNTTIEKELPRTGIIKDKIRIDKTKDNFVVQLDRPINFENYDFDEVVVRNRHVAQYIGRTGEIDVHLLIPRVKLVKEKYKIDDFSHVAWLTLKRR